MNNIEKYAHVLTRADLLKNTKYINVPLYGSIPISLMAKYFIDNRYFQRLKELKQLGTCDFIFPGATHTRFEHSIGTYYLADRMLSRIRTSSDKITINEWLQKIPELKIHYNSNHDQIASPGLNMWISELIKIAALCHDVGHGPYSHLFDDIFVKNSKYKDHKYASHEQRSCEIIRLIVGESEILSKFITSDDIKFIQDIIDPKPHMDGFVYQIVSNNLNGLDVDKYDYINRDAYHTGIKSGFDCFRLIDFVLIIDNIIVYPEQSEYEIYNLFTTRHAMHRRVYGHKGVVSAQNIIIDVMMILDKVLNIGESITNMETFIKMTDSYVLNYIDFILDVENQSVNPFSKILSVEDYLKLKELKLRLQTHNLYPHIGTLVTKQISNIYDMFKSDNYIIYRSKIGFVSGNKSNPLNKIYVYKTKELFDDGSEIKAHLIDKSEISHIIPEIYQEYITMVFRKDRDPHGILQDKEIFQNIKDNV
jgi:HD superfamily phosphohydrolase